MIYLTYDNQGCQDGFGAQAQRILSIYWIARRMKWQYIHTPIVKCEHNISREELNKFNQLILLPSDNKINEVSKSIQMRQLNVRQIMKYVSSQNIVIKITFAHNYIDSNSYLLSQPYPYSFTWIQDQINNPINIVVHIRRGDVTETQNSQRYISLDYYMSCLGELKSIMENRKIKYQIHIHSDGESSVLGDQKFPLGGLSSWHINENLPETFQSFVNADILFAGFSSLSYTATFLRKKGCVLYPPFWHQYSTQAICLRNSTDVMLNQETILRPFI